MIHKIIKTMGLTFVLASGLAVSACQYSPGNWKYYDEGLYEERIWFDGWDRSFLVGQFKDE